MRIAAAFLLSLFLTTAAHASDLVTRSGKVYHDYRIVAHDAGYVTILDSEGGAHVPLSDLPADLQRQYNYDPAQAAAFVHQFTAADHQASMAVVQAQASTLAPSTSPAPEVVRDANPTVAPSSSGLNDAAAPEEKSFADSSVTDGFDPLAAGADIFHPENSETTPLNDTPDIVVDSAGQTWVSSVDAVGMIHWYPREFGRDYHEDRNALRLAGNTDLPDGAVVTTDLWGRWVVTYIDPQGHMQRFIKGPADLHLAPGAWTIAVDRYGHRMATRESREGHPHNFTVIHYSGSPTQHSFTSTGSFSHFGSSSFRNSSSRTYSTSHSSTYSSHSSGSSSSRTIYRSAPAPVVTGAVRR